MNKESDLEKEEIITNINQAKTIKDMRKTLRKHVPMTHTKKDPNKLAVKAMLKMTGKPIDNRRRLISNFKTKSYSPKNTSSKIQN
jgi:hypothetical protein